MTTRRHVLVIDEQSETATVLQAVLEPRGTVVERTRTQRLQARPDDDAEPDVVVVDLDNNHSSAPPSSEVWETTPHVFISSHRVLVNDTTSRFLQKPFQFPELLRAVEDLLQR